MGILSSWHWLFLVGAVGFFIWIYARIAHKAGFSGWWGVIMIVPLVNLVMLWVFAFVKWPAEASKKRVAEIFE